MRRILVVALLVSLAGCGGDDLPDTMTGVTVTDNVPFACESAQDIADRDPLPPTGDRVIPPHTIR